jgi:hypothetical protein
MARFGEHAAWFAFTSDRFDHDSELPPDANAGNRFYGRDVAEFLAAGLTAQGLDASFLDEDWGWQVHATRASNQVLEISIYHNPEDDPATADDWELMLRSLRKERVLGLLSRFRETPVADDAVALLDTVFRESGIELTPALSR